MTEDVVTYHGTDDCPVDDLVKEMNHARLSPRDKAREARHQQMQLKAIDNYHNVLRDTGNVKLAEQTFFETFNNDSDGCTIFKERDTRN